MLHTPGARQVPSATPWTMSILNFTHEDRVTVLLAEDDENDLLLIRRAVKRLEIIQRLLAVRSGEEVLAYLEGDNGCGDRLEYPFPDLLILDNFMPRWSGLDVLLWIRSSRRFQDLPVVILSVGLSPGRAQEARLLKAACCPKAPQFGGLAAAIQDAFRLVQAPTVDSRLSDIERSNTEQVGSSVLERAAH